MRNFLGGVIYIIGGLYVFIVESIYLYELFGIGGIVTAILFFPIVLVIMPFYALFAIGDWTLLVISILTPIIANLLMAPKKSNIRY